MNANFCNFLFLRLVYTRILPKDCLKTPNLVRFESRYATGSKKRQAISSAPVLVLGTSGHTMHIPFWNTVTTDR